MEENNPNLHHLLIPASVLKGEEKRVIAIIQARMASSRLPGKVLYDLGGEPMLVRVVERVRRAKKVHQIVVATTTDQSDDPVAKLCAQRGYSCFRGSQRDVLDRFTRAARGLVAEVIVRITGDCPVIDPGLVDEIVQAFMGRDAAPGSFDFGCNRLPPPFTRTYPIGLDTEVCSIAALERAWQEANQAYHREHVMPYLYEGIQKSERVQKLDRSGYFDIFLTKRGFRVFQVNHEPDYGYLRWTVDTPTDLEVIRRIYSHFAGRVDFSWREILALVQSEPGLSALNAGIYHKDFRESEQKV